MPIDMSAAKAPPSRAGRKAPIRTQSSVPVNTQTPTEQRYDGLMGIGSLGQGMCFMAKQYAQAATFGQHWAPIAKEVATLSATQPTVAKYVDLVITAGPYAALIQAVIPFAMQTLANYGLINAENAGGGGIVPPAILEPQMKADMARMQTQALRDQQQAMQEAANAQAEYNRQVVAHQEAQRQQLQDNVNNHGWDPKLHDTASVS